MLTLTHYSPNQPNSHESKHPIPPSRRCPSRSPNIRQPARPQQQPNTPPIHHTTNSNRLPLTTTIKSMTKPKPTRNTYCRRPTANGQITRTLFLPRNPRLQSTRHGRNHSYTTPHSTTPPALEKNPPMNHWPRTTNQTPPHAQHTTGLSTSSNSPLIPPPSRLPHTTRNR